MNLILKVISLLAITICWTSCQETAKSVAPSAIEETTKKTGQKISMDDLKASKDGKSPTRVTDAAKEALEKMRPSPKENKRRLANNRDHCNSLIDSRSKKEKAYAMMTVQPMLYQFVFNGKEMSKQGEYDGRWIHFMDDFTYQKGKYDTQTSTGRWHLTLESMKLIMVDSDESKMPEEFTVMTKEDVVIMQGSDYFGNNPLQMKLQKGPKPTAVNQ